MTRPRRFSARTRFCFATPLIALLLLNVLPPIAASALAAAKRLPPSHHDTGSLILTVQSSQAESKPTEPASPPPVGTTICAALENSVNAKKAKAGDAISAKVTLAVLSRGKVVITEDSKIEGHVTEVKTRSESDPESRLGLVFDRAEIKGGGELPLALTVQALGTGSQLPSNRQPAPGIGRQPNARREDPFGVPLDPTRDALPMALDAGSKGIIGLHGLTLTESTGPGRASVVESSTENVKLDSGSQVILRVIGETPPSGPAQ
jgi:hypothetical protein